MIWVRFPFRVKYGGTYHSANEDVLVADDDLAQLEAMGAKIVRAVYEPDEDPKPAVKEASAAAPKRRGRKPKNA